MRQAILSAIVLCLVACGQTPRDPEPDPEPSDAGTVCVPYTGAPPPASLCWEGGAPEWDCIVRRHVCR